MRRGMAAIDGRSTEGRAALQWRNEVLRALGGQKRLSPQRSMLLDTLTLRVYRWLLISGWITAGKKAERILDRRRKRTWPIVAELDTLEAGIYRDLEKVGWDRRQPTPLWG